MVDYNQSGLGRYATELLEGYHTLEKKVTLIRYKNNNGWTNHCGFKEVSGKRLPYYTNVPLQIAAMVRKSKCNLIHYPVHFSENIGSYLINNRVKTVLTIHDISPMLHDNDKRIWYDQPDIETQTLWQWGLRLASKRADHIITVSENTKRDCVKYLGIPPEKITVIPCAASPIFHPRPEKDVIAFLHNIGIQQPYVFYTGGLSSRKNVERLLDAYEILCEEGYWHNLLIAGNSPDKTHAESIQNRFGDRVIFTGHVPPQTLAYLYCGADMFVYPSLYEGFGIPPLEAMASGTPTITSNTSSLPEVVGDAGIMVDPNSTSELYCAMKLVANNKNVRDKLKFSGLERASHFKWIDIAKRTWKVYEDIFYY
ncbi:MAG: glycosyltransferase family 1 protein [Terracidiphilus sp.]